jgi:hypothetical protein
MTDMIERVKAAIERTYDVDPGGDMTNPDQVARAAIEAMREPTPAMIDRFVSRALQVSLGGGYTWSDYARDQWATMITAALEDAGE